MTLDEMEGMTEDEKQFSQDSRLFNRYVNEGEFHEAYEVFKRNKEIVNFTEFYVLAEAYCGLKILNPGAAKEFRDYIIQDIELWDIQFAIENLMRRVRRSIKAPNN